MSRSIEGRSLNGQIEWGRRKLFSGRSWRQKIGCGNELEGEDWVRDRVGGRRLGAG